MDSTRKMVLAVKMSFMVVPTTMTVSSAFVFLFDSLVVVATAALSFSLTMISFLEIDFTLP